MKVLKLSLVFLLLIATFGCGDDDDGAVQDDEIVQDDFNIRVDIDGDVLERDDATGIMDFNGRMMGIASPGEDDVPDLLFLQIGSLDPADPILAEGTYSTSEFNTEIFYTVDNTDGVQFFTTNATGVSGSVTITDLDVTNKTISGTFQGTLIDPPTGETIVFSNGEFNEVTYIEQ